MYPLDQGLWGPTVRIIHIRDELAKLVALDVVSGYRGSRRGALLRYAFSGRLRGLDAIYVESSSFLPSETDIAFLGLARALGVPVLTYIRDAYQLFPEYRVTGTLRSWIGARAFLPAIRALRAVSSTVAFPSEGLAQAVVADGEHVLIPPGSPPPAGVPRLDGACELLFVGNGRLEAQGAPRLLEAVRKARERGASVELRVVSRAGEEPAGTLPPWVHVSRAEGSEINELLRATVATVIPRPRGAYNDLAVPIKLYDYLAYERPLLVTDCLEQAALVRRADAGIVTGDAPAEMADAILHMMNASNDALDRWSTNARSAALAGSWASRAALILDSLRLTS